MGMPTSRIKCKKCDYGVSSMLLWGVYVYVDQQDELDCNKTYGWCNHCSEITAVEDFTNITGQLEQIRIRSTWLRNESASFWHHFICLFSKNKRKYSQSHLNDINIAVKSIALANKRRGNERCLSCGSTEVQILNVVDQTLREQGALGTNSNSFAHPNCGGEFLIEKDNIWFSVRGKKKIYTADGLFVEEIIS